jgi:hypothetical protein
LLWRLLRRRWCLASPPCLAPLPPCLAVVFTLLHPATCCSPGGAWPPRAIPPCLSLACCCLSSALRCGLASGNISLRCLEASGHRDVRACCEGRVRRLAGTRVDAVTEAGAAAEPDKAQEDMTRYQELARAALADTPDAAAAGQGGGAAGGAGGIGWGGEEHESTSGDKQLRRFRKRLQRSPHQVISLPVAPPLPCAAVVIGRPARGAHRRTALYLPPLALPGRAACCRYRPA